MYLIRDYTDVRTGDGGRVTGEPVDRVVHGVADLVLEIDRAKTDGRKISVHEIGECLLDWT